ncbi:uridylate kinase [Enterobacter hormaechei ATCC 49162]|nr:uridylate kinase [Enterobacter hormaechei ATCC 49162]
MGRRLTPDERNNKKKYGKAMLNRAGITWGYSVPISGVHVEFLIASG